MRRLLPLLVLPALAAAAPAHAQDAPAEREYAVWSALLDTRNGPPHVTRIVVVDSTREGDHGLSAGPWPVGGVRVPDDVLQSFREANTKPWPLENRFGTSVPVHFLSQAMKQATPEHSGDREGRGRLPGAGGVVTMSRVGFSGDGRTALVFHRVICGSLCGEDAYFLLALGADARWGVVHKLIIREY